MAQLVARYLGVVEAASSSLVTQTSVSVHKGTHIFYRLRDFDRLPCTKRCKDVAILSIAMPFSLFPANLREISRFRNIINGLVLP